MEQEQIDAMFKNSSNGLRLLWLCLLSLHLGVGAAHKWILNEPKELRTSPVTPTDIHWQRGNPTRVPAVPDSSARIETRMP